MSIVRSLVVPGVLWSLGSCTPYKRVQAPEIVDASQFSVSGEAPVSQQWWTAFADAGLTEWVEAALEQNLDVREAQARVEAARAVVRSGRSVLAPSVRAFADSSVGTADPFGGLQRVPIELGVSASYTVDLFGGQRAQVRGQARRRDATAEDARTVRLAVASAATTAWLQRVGVEEQLRVLDEQITANEQLAELVRNRVRNGQARPVDSLRQDQLVEQTRAERVARRQEASVLDHQLAVLVGRSPTDARGGPYGRLPDTPPLPAAGLPAALLRRRPDVRAAEHRLAAVDADVAVAIADRFPRLSLGARASNAPANLEAVLTGWVAALGANLAAPLFEMGARKAEVTRRRALLDAELAVYERTLLVALQEVEDALARNRHQEELVLSLERQLGLAQQAAAQLERRYAGGFDVAYLDVLTAQTSAQTLQRRTVAARQVLLVRRVELYQALAGGPDPVESEDG